MNPIRLNNMLQAISKIVSASESKIEAVVALGNSLNKEIASILSSIASIRTEIQDIRKDIQDMKEESSKFKNRASSKASPDSSS